MAEYDVAVLGAGPGGYVAALRAAVLGAKVCLVEKRYFGGTCLNVGCIPTKALLHTSEIFHHMQRAGEYGLASGGTPTVDFTKVMARTRKVVAGLTGGVGQLLKARKVEVFMGTGKLVGDGRIEVTADDGTTQTVSAENIIIATGSAPARPGMFPFDDKHVVTTDQATTSDYLPEEIMIVGGGIIGCEFATLYSELGCKVTVVEMLDSLCPGIDPDAVREITRSLKKRGVTIKVGTKISEMKVTGDKVVASVEGSETITVGLALIAVGRVPMIRDIGLESLGVETENGVIKVDARCKTNVPGVLAIGDCATAVQFAHVASRMGNVAAETACGHDAADDLGVVPSGVYTHPEIGMVGISEAQAKEQGLDVRVVKFPLRASG
ncbi:MAG: dihydrolipoyl dehydrogenase, partial [Anaerolineaceae bacterium]|nr:dihydrolipoyl dehydrogenase [Anaerolineaceae bacterium]